MAEEITGMYASLNEPEQYLVHDMQFHQTIAAASSNRILTSLMNMVATILFDSRSKTVKRATDLKESAEQHHNIYRAMREHDPEAARQGDARSPDRNAKGPAARRTGRRSGNGRSYSQ